MMVTLRGKSSSLAWLLAVLLLGALHGGRLLAAAAPPTVTGLAATPGGSFEYAWTVEKTVNGLAKDATADVRVQKGTRSQINYKIVTTRTVSSSNLQLTVSGGFSISNPNPTPVAPPPSNTIVINTVRATVTWSGGSAPVPVLTGCADGLVLNPGSGAQCAFADLQLPVKPDVPVRVEVDIVYTDNSQAAPVPTPLDPVTSGEVVFTGITGKYKTALLTDSFDLTALSGLYSQFTSFNKDDVFHRADPNSGVPAGGVTIDADRDVREYAMVAENLLVCTMTDAGVLITNTAKLTPTGSGTTLQSAAYVRLVIFGCSVPPDVNFQELTSWAAQPFSWELQHRPQRTSFTVKPEDGSVSIPYVLTPRATDTAAATYAVSGALFVTNTQPGLMNIALLQVTVGSQRVTPNCALTAPYVSSSNNMIWGGINAGGSTTILPYLGGGIGSTYTYGNGYGYSSFLLPEFASARCPFNVTVTDMGGSLQVVANVNWGFGGMFMLNQPPQQTVTLKPADKFFPVSDCLKLSNQVVAGPLVLTNNFPNDQQVCVLGNVAPWAQPNPVNYDLVVSLNPDLVGGCTDGSLKTYTIANTARGQPNSASAVVTGVADSVTLNVQCPLVVASPAPSGNIVTQTPMEAEAKLNVSVGSFQTYIQSGHAWTVDQGVDGAMLAVQQGGGSKVVKYLVRVTKYPAKEVKRFVAGIITVTNTGQLPADVSAVAVTSGAAAVSAVCDPSRLGAPLAVGDALECSFNVTWNRGAEAGFLGARVDTAAGGGSFFAPSKQFDFTDPKATADTGTTANVTIDFSQRRDGPPDGAPDFVWFRKSRDAPPSPADGADGVTLETADSKDYVFDVEVGPFPKGAACGTYFLESTAVVTPSDGSAPPAKSEGVIAVSVTGCSAALEQYTGANVAPAITGASAAVIGGSTWTIESEADPRALNMDAKYSAEVTFNVRLVKSETKSYEVSGSVAVANSNPSKAVAVSGVSVLVDPKGAAPPVAADVTCPSGLPLSIAVGGTETCTFVARLPAPGAGEAVATVTEADGRQTESAAAPFTFDGAPARTASNMPDCALVKVGEIVGLSHWRPDGALGFDTSEHRVCTTMTMPVPAVIGPFDDSQCGEFDVIHVTTLTPLARAAAPVTGVARLPVTVYGCSKGSRGAAEVAVGDGRVTLVDTFDWKVSLSHSAPSPLVVERGTPSKVMFTVKSDKGAAKRTAEVAGKVLLEATSDAPVKIDRATVSVYDGKDAYTSAPLDCGAAGGPGGGVLLKGKGSQAVCSYSAKGLQPADGVVLPTLILEGASKPLAASPAAYKAAGARRVAVGRCADRGSASQLLAGGRLASWRPAPAGRGFGGTDCRGGTERFAMWFGAASDGSPAPPPAGDYDFEGSVTLLPQGGAPVTADVKFPVKVVDA